MKSFFDACLEANKELAEYLEHGLSSSDMLKGSKGAGGDLSSGIDLVAEKIFIKHLLAFGEIDSEEAGLIGNGDKRIVIDPIDGSSNILSNFPYYGTSIAIFDTQGKPEAAVISNLATGRIYFKQASQEPFGLDLKSGQYYPVHLSNNPEISIFEKAYAYPDIVSLLNSAGYKFRSPGAVALSLVYARSAQFFLYMGAQRSYDFAAGLLFCEDMEVEVNDQYVILSRDKSTLKQIKDIVENRSI